MQDFEGKVAVVTGGASGIGRAMGERFGQEGMRVVLADVEEEALAATVAELRRSELEVTGVLCDVSSADAVKHLAEETLAIYGGVHVLCNNAGVAAGGAIIGDRQQYVWEQPLSDWTWTLNVNLWGVVHGIRTFVPIMLAQGEPAHIVNTASTAGLTTGPGLAIYGVSKHGVVRLSEAMYFQLQEASPHVRVSVLCPGGVRTRIAAAGRNRPDDLLEADIHRLDASEVEVRTQNWFDRIADQGQDPEEIAEKVLDAIREEQFYILTHETQDRGVRMRMEQILGRRNPEVPAPLA